MAFEKIVPEWNATGAEPPASLKESGFVAGYKPPAAYFNWFWHSVSEALAELQGEAVSKVATAIESGTLDDCTDVGIYVYSAANSANITNAPEQVQSALLVLPRLLPNDVSNRIQMVLTQTNHLYLRSLTGGDNWGSWGRMRNSDEVIPVVYGGTGSTTVAEIRNTINLPEKCITITDWNSATKNGWYMGLEAENAPSATWYFGFAIAHNENYVFQEVYSFTNSSVKATDLTKYIRSCYQGTWTEWVNVTVQRTVPEGAKLQFTTGLTSDAQAQLNNKMQAKPAFIELTPGKDSEHGGYIDFHFAGSEDDNTSRIIESAKGLLNMMADVVKIKGVLQIADGDAGLYGDDHTVNVVTKSDVTNDYKRSIQLMNKAYEADLADALILIDKDSGGSRNYKLYGEHNKPSTDDIVGMSSYGKIATGSYTGTGDLTVTITCGFKPKLVFVHQDLDYAVSDQYRTNTLYAGNSSVQGGSSSKRIFTATDIGLIIEHNEYCDLTTAPSNSLGVLNVSGTTYHWVAIG